MMKTMSKVGDVALVLASGSAARRAVLEGAGVPVRVVPSSVDERAAEAAVNADDLSAGDIAMILAQLKAEDVASCLNGDAIVIGADQVLVCEGEKLDKVTTMAQARRRLLELRGKTHTLVTAAVCVRNGDVVWRHEDEASLRMANIDAQEVGHYLAAAGERVLASSGCCELEGPGVRLLEKIEGDYFSILGLPLLPLLMFLRREGVALGWSSDSG